MRRVLCMVLGIIYFSGCTMIPKYKQPAAPVPDQWPTGPAYPAEQSTLSALEAAQIKWQEFFTDPKLQKVIAMAIENNRDLRLAVLNTERARGLYGISIADLLPIGNANGSGNEQKASRDFTAPGTSMTSKFYDVNLGIAAWEVDFFGRIRSLERQALEDYLGTDEARRSTQISLVSDVARIYLTVASERANLKLAKSTLETQLGSYKLIEKRYKLKLANEIDLRRVQTQVDTARGDVAQYTQRVAQAQNALNFLTGISVPEDLLPSDLASVSPFKDISPGLSSQVLLRRPDIMAAEHRLKGANANIGAARAAFFPRISLTTALGTASNDLSSLFAGGTSTWFYGAQATMPIFDARTWFAYRVSKADREIAVTQYEKTIQTAFREVADVLAVRGTVNQQIAAQQSLVDSSQKIYDLSEKRYNLGIDDYLSVLDAQRSLYSAQRNLIFLQVTKLANEVRAYAVLGGGVDYPKATKSSLMKKFFRIFRI